VTTELIDELWSLPVAVTAAHDGRDNGLIALTAVPATIVPEAPRLLVELAQTSLTHELVLASRAFALHLLPTPPDATTIALVDALGLRSGRDGDKLGPFARRRGMTGAPILLDVLGYLEAEVAATLDLGELTVVVGDVVVSERLRDGAPLGFAELDARMPPGWLDRNRAAEVAEARRRRGPTRRGDRPAR
jgi:flavin reductase (DIM6/NTAB) family NADH-FMN oxidoreductase RutF